MQRKWLERLAKPWYKLRALSIFRDVSDRVAARELADMRMAELAHLADQVFLELSREIEAQGVSRKVAADALQVLRGVVRSVQAGLSHGSACAGGARWWNGPGRTGG